jgi:hypothetical protein
VLEHLQTHRQILFDFTANYLEPLNGAYQRLAYLFSLREPSSGRYVHDRLSAIYGADSVNEVLSRCHEEVFERLLEMPLSSQEDDLRQHVKSLEGSFVENARRCREMARDWVPRQAPVYLKELFASNLEVLFDLLLDSRSAAHPDM